MSDYVVIARFDENTNRKFIAMQDKLVAAGYSVPEWPPHITIAAYENFDEMLLCERTAAFSEQYRSFNIALHSLSVLPPGGEHTDTAVLCLDPAHSKSFIDFYYAFHEKYEEYCTGIGAFNSIVNDNPVLHATIAIVGLHEMQTAMNLIFESNIFGLAEITALEVYSYPMRLIQRYELKK